MQLSPEATIIFPLLGSLILLTFYLIFRLHKLTSHYNSLTKGIDKHTLMNVLQGLQSSHAEHEKLIAALKQEIQKIKTANLLHIQRVELKRFNPFSDTGGDQSFILAILDGNQDGVVLTSLHSRENTRFYVKSVKGGNGIDHPLSQEEQKIINHRGK